jgi:hypothetical protein
LAKAKYFAKHAVQKIIGLIPYGYSIQEGIKERLQHWDRRSPSGTTLKHLKSAVERLNAHGIEPPKVVVEQGTGWSGTDLLIFYLGGAERILTYDVRPWLRVELMRRSAREILDAPEVLAGWNGIDSDVLRDRSEILRRSLNLPLTEMLSVLKIEYRTNTRFDYTEAEDESVDLFFSNSTLQRIRPEVLRKIVHHSRRFLKNGGVSCHRVHMHDIHRITDKRVPHYYYLTISDRLWNLMTTTYLNYQNRMRMPEFIALFDGFHIETDNVLWWEQQPVGYVKERLMDKYPDFTLQQIAAWQVDIFARKN